MKIENFCDECGESIDDFCATHPDAMVMSMQVAETLDGRAISVPVREVTEDLPTCTLVPLRGFNDRVAVMDGDGECIGWIRTDSI